jgi:transposase-like protein
MARRLDGSEAGRLFARRRWSAENARAVLEHLDASAMTVREFAARHGLDAQRLNRWRSQLASARPTPPPRFVEIRRPATIEVALRSGHVVRVPDGFAEETLRRVVAVLDGQGGTC